MIVTFIWLGGVEYDLFFGGMLVGVADCEFFWLGLGECDLFFS